MPTNLELLQQEQEAERYRFLTVLANCLIIVRQRGYIDWDEIAAFRKFFGWY